MVVKQYFLLQAFSVYERENIHMHEVNGSIRTKSTDKKIKKKLFFI